MISGFSRWRGWLAVAGPLGLLFAGAWQQGIAAPPKTKPRAIDYNRDVRPILSKCFTCHGNDPKAVRGGLKIDDVSGATKKLADGKRAIVPFHPEQSELIRRINDSGFGLMPPKSSNKTLTAEEKKILRQWISEGAEYKPHWAFVKPVRRPLPAVHNKSWPKNGIDFFILQRLELAGLSPSPATDRRTLIRRVTLDLTGLPPTPKEVDDFLKDSSPNAYEKVVDRLLASPRYGERMAMDWVDFARYADSNGYQADYERFQWRWRDWVLDAFNQDMPYDRFTVEQLAGDLLPNPTLNQKIATGFNRNHRINTEGGVVAEEWRVETVIDRVETTSTVWLGLTAGCARCHDHKYDPLSQKEFYSLFAYFNNVPESGTGEERPVNHPPYIKAPTDEQLLREKVLTGRFEDLDKQASAKLDSVASVPESWRVPEVSEGRVARYVLKDSPSATPENLPVPKPVDQITFGPGISTGALRTGKGYVDLGDVGDFDKGDAFSYGLWLKPDGMGGSPMSRMDAGHDYRGWDLFMMDGRPAVHIVSKWPEDAAKVYSRVAIPKGKWSHVFVTYDGSSKASGIRIYIDGQPAPLDTERDDLRSSIRTPVTAKIGRRTGADEFVGEVDDPAIYRRKLDETEVRRLASAGRVQAIQSLPADRRSPEDRKALARYWLNETDAEFRQLEMDREKARRERDEVDASIPTVMVMEEMPKPRQAKVLVRGQYDHPGADVSASIPAVLRIPGKTFAPNRLGLAKWIVDPDNPLTARVTVNRLWERLFGAGIVATSEDFGTRADFPTHPELLDWLATEFVRLGWRLKPMLKEMVMSATYRQSSNVSAQLLKVDPQNRLLARGPRFRLPAEVLRDQAMLVGGLLNEKLGGPSVRPYQPDGVWDEVNVYGNLRNYKHDMGPGLHRRSLYTIWKRTAAPPNMTLFDVPSRETCRVRRARTNTPLQALVLLNDVTYVEAARALAQRMMIEGGSTPEARLAFGFRTLLARDPSAEESRILRVSFARQLARYTKDRDAAKRFVAEGDAPHDPKLDIGELAAYQVVASILLNLDETLTRE